MHDSAKKTHHKESWVTEVKTEGDEGVDLTKRHRQRRTYTPPPRRDPNDPSRFAQDTGVEDPGDEKTGMPILEVDPALAAAHEQAQDEPLPEEILKP